MKYVLIACATLIVAASFFMVRYLYEIVLMDAKSRGINHPKFWALVAAGGQRGEGLLWYLFKRRNTRALQNTIEARRMNQLKTKIYYLMAVDVMSAIFFVATLVKMN